jgi:flagellar motor protein MotB
MARVEDKDDKSKKVDEVVESVYLNSVHDAAARNALQALVATHYAPLCATLLMRCGTAHGVDEHVSAKQAARALKRFFKAARQDPLLAALEEQESKEDLAAHDDVGRMLLREVSDAWETMDSETYDDAITVVTRQVCRHKPGKMGEILTFLSSFYSQQAYVGQRVVATAMLAEFVSHSADDHALQAELIKFLLPRVADKVAKVRKQALRGLGNLVMVWTEQIAQHATAVISSLSGASEDAEAEVAAEAVSALTRIAKVVDLVTIGPMLVSICFRMRPTFDRKSAKVRKAAFTLFSELCHFGRKLELDDSSVNENFIDQVHFNLPIYLAHVNEDDRDTAECAFKGLRNIFALLDDSLVALVDRVGEVDEDNYDSFINECSKLLALHYGDRLRGYLDSCVGYFPSTWTRIRANAVYMLACLIRHSRESKMADARKKLNMHALTAAVVKMLEQDNESVRNKTVKALSLLYDV